MILHVEVTTVDMCFEEELAWDLTCVHIHSSITIQL